MLLAALAKTTYCGFVFSSLGPETELRVENVPGMARTVSRGPFCPRCGYTWWGLVAMCLDASSAFLIPPRVTLHLWDFQTPVFIFWGRTVVPDKAQSSQEPLESCVATSPSPGVWINLRLCYPQLHLEVEVCGIWVRFFLLQGKTRHFKGLVARRKGDQERWWTPKHKKGKNENTDSGKQKEKAKASTNVL